MRKPAPKWETEFRRKFGSPHCEHLRPGVTTKQIVVHLGIAISKAQDEAFLQGIQYQKNRWRRWFRFLP